MYPAGNATGSNIGMIGTVSAQTNAFSGFDNNTIKAPRPNDTKGALKYDIEQERIRLQQMEARCRAENDKLRQEHEAATDEINIQADTKRKQNEEERKQITQDKNSAIEEAKKKI